MASSSYTESRTLIALGAPYTLLNCHGQDLTEVAIEGASDAARAGKGNLVVGACHFACLDTPGCIAWTLDYGSAGMQGTGHCRLKTSSLLAFGRQSSFLPQHRAPAWLHGWTCSFVGLPATALPSAWLQSPGHGVNSNTMHDESVAAAAWHSAIAVARSALCMEFAN